MTNDLTALKKKHAELGEEIARLEKQGENPWGLATQPQSFYYWRHHHAGQKLRAISADFPSENLEFINKEAAQRFADAIQVMLELRAPELGAVNASENRLKNKFQPRAIETSFGLELSIEAVKSEANNDRVCPFYLSLQAAQHAIDTVGHARIIAAFRTLAGLEA